jgi:hypothetical protein
MKTHYLKCWPEYFKSLAYGDKKFELRKDDRDFQIGDTLIIKEWNGEFTGNELKFYVSYILRDAVNLGLMEGYCILSLKKLIHIPE